MGLGIIFFFSFPDSTSSFWDLIFWASGLFWLHYLDGRANSKLLSNIWQKRTFQGWWCLVSYFLAQWTYLSKNQFCLIVWMHGTEICPEFWAHSAHPVPRAQHSAQAWTGLSWTPAVPRWGCSGPAEPVNALMHTPTHAQHPVGACDNIGMFIDF